MAQWQITHSCGHTCKHQLFGAHADRERRVEWLAGQPCPDCQKAAANAASAEAAKAAGRSALTGSEKQIAWATTLRETAINKINDDKEQFASYIYSELLKRLDGDKIAVAELIINLDPDPARRTDSLVDIAEYAINDITDSRVWIDNRWSLVLLIAAYVAEMMTRYNN